MLHSSEMFICIFFYLMDLMFSILLLSWRFCLFKLHCDDSFYPVLTNKKFVFPSLIIYWIPIKFCENTLNYDITIRWPNVNNFFRQQSHWSCPQIMYFICLKTITYILIIHWMFNISNIKESFKRLEMIESCLNSSTPYGNEKIC